MDLGRPRFALREEIFAARPARAAGIRFQGLWLAGSLQGLERPTVAVVGSRAPSEGGIARARELGTMLAGAHVCVLSGLALGIDGAAHAGALAGHGLTIGVLGGGHRHFFPRRNRTLGQAMVEAGGAVLSPYEPDAPARPTQFLQRNAVVAALADVVVVVEAAERSGALNTAGWAASLGIDVLAYPGDVDRPKAAGCNALIRDGAILARHPGDVLAALGLEEPALPRRRGAASPDASDFETTLLRALARGPADIDSLALALGPQIATGTIVAALVRLEIAGSVERRDALTYARATPATRDCSRRC